MGGCILCDRVGKIYINNCEATGDGVFLKAVDSGYVEIQNSKTSTSCTPYILENCDEIVAENNHHNRIIRLSFLSQMIMRALYE